MYGNFKCIELNFLKKPQRAHTLPPPLQYSVPQQLKYFAQSHDATATA